MGHGNFSYHVILDQVTMDAVIIALLLILVVPAQEALDAVKIVVLD